MKIDLTSVNIDMLFQSSNSIIFLNLRKALVHCRSYYSKKLIRKKPY